MCMCVCVCSLLLLKKKGLNDSLDVFTLLGTSTHVGAATLNYFGNVGYVMNKNQTHFNFTVVESS